LTAQLLAFSRKGRYRTEAVDIHRVVDEVVSILKHTINRRIVIKKTFTAEPSYVQGDPSLIQSALLNLALNARDAMPESGEIFFYTEIVTFDDAFCKQNSFDLKPGYYLQISVTDSGVGMDAETLEHIYEPFFTTKKPGEGTGMGLAAVYGTMKIHGGAIGVYSEAGKGATFRLYFPIGTPKTVSKGEREDASTGAEPQRSPVPNRDDLILVVDDEKMVAAVAAEHLRSAGYHVRVFTDSPAALSFFREKHTAVSLVILDMIMPALDEAEMYHAFKAVNPKIPAILSSGFSLNGATQALLDDGARAFIQKPFRRTHLLRTVRRVLKEAI
jgi:CheY-like chemotaxis protein